MARKPLGKRELVGSSGGRRVISLDAWERGRRGGGKGQRASGASRGSGGEARTNVTQSHSRRPGLSPLASRSDTGPSEINSRTRTEVADITHPSLRGTQLQHTHHRLHHLLAARHRFMSMTTPSHHISVQQEAQVNGPPESQTTDTLPDIPQKQSVTKGIGMKTIDRTAERSGGSIPKKVRTGSRTLRRISSVDAACGSSFFSFSSLFRLDLRLVVFSGRLEDCFVCEAGSR